MLRVCVCFRKKGIDNSHQSSASCLSQQLVCRRAVRIINYTHSQPHTLAYIITVNSCWAGLASAQITSLSQWFLNNVPILSPTGALLYKDPNKNIPQTGPVSSTALRGPLLLTLLMWPLTPADMSERSRGDRLSEDSGSGGKRALDNEWEVCLWVLGSAWIFLSICLQNSHLT